MGVEGSDQTVDVAGEIPKRVALALALAVAFTTIYSTIQWLIIGIEIPSLTGMGAADTTVFFGVQIFLWFLLWYWILRLRHKLKRIKGEM
ncbi:MAG: hypothetical protein ACLFUV_02815 [Methanomassiliicoccales archaeon]